ncbi:CDP-diacylglycerol--glycerol-3-phosphate 3-phosphatidyltransferase [Pseudonocardia nematodicida]|uniref:CDP-diacylglycerol--glycerol-3-phosphate 3-phosphatidyltransferase n=1 Tax=Pseudonocardia nematodicida TaxID=1206997 RepID=A0ABV1KIN3_9PSEU
MSSSQPAGGTVPVGGGEVPLLNIANVLTVLRLVMVPVFVAALFAGDGQDVFWRTTAFLVFVLAALTDRLDGQLARSRGLVTWFGALADPIADKALTGAALVGLSMLGLVPWWVTVVILGRELGITVLRFVVIRRGVIAASRGGKAKTVAQTVAIALILFPLPLLLPGWLGAVVVLQWTALVIALVLTVVTGIDYVVKAVRAGANPAPDGSGAVER